MRRTVNEGELVECAEQMKLYNWFVRQHLGRLVDELVALDESWEGIAVSAFLETVNKWRVWSDEMSEAVAVMADNAHSTHQNYTANARIDVSMWGG